MLRQSGGDLPTANWRSIIDYGEVKTQIALTSKVAGLDCGHYNIEVRKGDYICCWW